MLEILKTLNFLELFIVQHGVVQFLLIVMSLYFVKDDASGFSCLVA